MVFYLKREHSVCVCVLFSHLNYQLFLLPFFFFLAPSGEYKENQCKCVWSSPSHSPLPFKTDLEISAQIKRKKAELISLVGTVAPN